MVPINLALRDINMEEHDVTGDDAWVYNSMYDLMTQLIDIANEIDPTLTLYGIIFRGKEKEVNAHTEHFLFQYDYLRLGHDNDADEFRMIWRNLAVGWYKHPRRCVIATRELSGAEQAMLLSEFRTDMTKFFETIRHEIPPPRSDEEVLAAAMRIRSKLGLNGVSGAMAIKSPGVLTSQLFGRLSEDNPDSIKLRDYQLDTKLMLEGAPLNQIFGKFGSDLRPSEVKSDVPAFMRGMLSKRREAKEKILGTPPEPGPLEDVGDTGRIPDVKVPPAIRELRDEFEHPDLQALLKTLQGEKGLPDVPAMAASPSPINFQSLSRLARDTLPVTIITSTPGLDNKGEWIYEAMRQNNVPTDAFIAIDPGNPDWSKNYIVRHAPHVCSGDPSGFVFEPSMDDYPWKVPAGTAPAEFVRNGRLRPKKIADMVKFATFVWAHAHDWMDILLRNHEQMHVAAYREFKKKG